ncbi:hypothetical protein V4762_08950 [Thermodesulfobium sp. 4217-1]|uniref:hypothetical protein n=1 Tax=Thermodesulfobium sp. 4217-1 TaxID=3120013 RepID=UPI003221A8F8
MDNAIELKKINVIVPPDKVGVSYVLDVNIVSNPITKNTILSLIGGLPPFQQEPAVQGVVLGNYLFDIEQLKKLAKDVNEILEKLEDKK